MIILANKAASEESPTELSRAGKMLRVRLAPTEDPTVVKHSECTDKETRTVKERIVSQNKREESSISTRLILSFCVKFHFNIQQQPDQVLSKRASDKLP